MSFTVQNVVDLARDWLNDDAKVRFPDAKGERFVNACVQSLALLRPDLFTTFGSITPTVDSFFQDLAASDSNILALFNIVAVVNGNAVLQCELRPLLAALPGAVYETSAAPVNWGRDPADQNAQSGLRYWLYPRPSTSTNLLMQYAKAPAYRVLAETVLGGGAVALSEAYRMPIAKGVQYCAETVDDEYVISARAMEGMQTFLSLVQSGATTKKVEPNP